MKAIFLGAVERKSGTRELIVRIDSGDELWIGIDLARYPEWPLTEEARQCILEALEDYVEGMAVKEAPCGLAPGEAVEVADSFPGYSDWNALIEEFRLRKP